VRLERQLKYFVRRTWYRDLRAGISRARTRLEEQWRGLDVGPRTKYLVPSTAVAVVLSLGVQACASAPVNATGIPVRVMTYNIRSGNGNLDSTAAAIRAQAPDIVALQEVDVHWADRSSFADQVTELATKLGMQGRFAPIYVLPGSTPGAPKREFGVALLSRYPIVRFRNDTIARLSTQVQDPVAAPAPGLLDAVLDVNGQPVRVFNTHLDYRKDPAVRVQQVREMLGYIGDLTVPTLVFGDMNAAPDAPELQPLLQRLHDAWAGSASPGFTYPADAPRERIDYVLVSPQFTVRSIRVPDTRASDHRPVVAELTLAPTAQ
jgi:endonuclease/exonuclease/phosphatase family metal-dependent hydrolase